MATGDPFDYVVTIESERGGTLTGRFQSATKIEEGQVITVHGKRCLVSKVSPDSAGQPGEPQVIFVKGVVVDE